MESELAPITGDVVIDVFIFIFLLVAFLLLLRLPCALQACLLNRKLKKIRYNSFGHSYNQSERWKVKRKALKELNFNLSNTREDVKADPLLRPIFWLVNYESIWKSYDFYQKLIEKYGRS